MCVCVCARTCACVCVCACAPGATDVANAEAVRPHKPDVLAGIESRGFLLAAPLALALGTGFVMLRKQGKLPGTTVRHTYALEYGTDTIEMHRDAVRTGERVLLIDDLIATGGTALAAVSLPDSLTSLGEHTFDGCSSLTAVTLPASLTSIGGKKLGPT